MSFLRLAVAFALVLIFGTYLAACDWWDRRKAGAEWEGEQ